MVSYGVLCRKLQSDIWFESSVIICRLSLGEDKSCVWIVFVLLLQTYNLRLLLFDISIIDLPESVKYMIPVLHAYNDQLYEFLYARCEIQLHSNNDAVEIFSNLKFCISRNWIFEYFSTKGLYFWWRLYE